MYLYRDWIYIQRKADLVYHAQLYFRLGKDCFDGLGFFAWYSVLV